MLLVIIDYFMISLFHTKNYSNFHNFSQRFVSFVIYQIEYTLIHSPHRSQNLIFPHYLWIRTILQRHVWVFSNDEEKILFYLKENKEFMPKAISKLIIFMYLCCQCLIKQKQKFPYLWIKKILQSNISLNYANKMFNHFWKLNQNCRSRMTTGCYVEILTEPAAPKNLLAVIPMLKTFS